MTSNSGSRHGGWCFSRVAERLRAMGHIVHTPTLTGLGDRSHLYHRDIDLDSHVTDILQLVKYERLDDFVLAGHSYGGMVISAVGDQCPTAIRRLVYLDGFVPDDNRCEMDYLPDPMVEGMRADAAEFDNEVRPIPAAAFHVNKADRAWVDSLCVKHPILTFEQKIHYTGGIERLNARKAFVWAPTMDTGLARDLHVTWWGCRTRDRVVGADLPGCWRSRRPRQGRSAGLPSPYSFLVKWPAATNCGREQPRTETQPDHRTRR